jgi:hypothetical protein
MSTSQRRSTTAVATRLSILARDAANLHLQLYELNELRDRVRQAERSTRKSRSTDKVCSLCLWPGRSGSFDTTAALPNYGAGRLNPARPDGSRGIALVDIEAIKDIDGNIVGNCFQDITERKRSEAQIVNLAREAEHRTSCPLCWRRCVSLVPIRLTISSN